MGRLRNGVGIGISNIPTLSSRRAFSPLSLFADGSQGVWYDDSLTSSMFQNCSFLPAALESPIGCQLDLSKNLEISAELITPAANRDFSSDTGYWTKQNAGITISGGTCNFIAVPAGFALSQASFATAGLVYDITFTISAISGGAIRAIAGSALTTTTAYSVAGTYTQRLCTVAGSNFGISSATSATTATITSISIKQVLGNHRFQSTDANRPTLSARYNLLTKTEQFDNAAWTKTRITVTANATTDPLGGNTADKLAENTVTSGEHYVLQTLTVVAASHTVSVYLKAAERTWASVYFSAASINSTWFNLAADGSGGVGTVGTGCTATATYVGNGWYQCSVTRTTTAAAWSLVINPALGDGVSVIYAGTIGSGIYAWGADVRLANQATGLIPTYQRVDTSSVYDTVGFPQYIKYDGLNSSLSTASINFTATAQMSVFSGVRKTNTTEGIIALLGTTLTSNGSFFLDAQSTLYQFSSKGTTQTGPNSAASYPSPETATLALLASISAPYLVGNRNGTQIVSSVATQGTGNYGTHPLYFGASVGTSLFFNGYEYQTIIVGKTLTATEIANTETYVNSKTKAY